MKFILPNGRKIELVLSPSRFSLEEFTERYIQSRLKSDEGNKPMVFNDLKEYKQFLNGMRSRERAYNFGAHNSCVDGATLCTHFNVLQEHCPLYYSVAHYSLALYGWKRAGE